MLRREDDTWDVQFTEDIGYLLNFGWIYARPSQPTIDFYQHAFDQYIAHNQWDVRLSPRVTARPTETPCEADAARIPNSKSCSPTWYARWAVANGAASPAKSIGGSAIRSGFASTCCP